ncbi:MAG: MotA/TolQ/ExbB proton channel family protein [Oscillospiraceae bacterium]|nr:MotA/TolQ/ExbB proton channel family protein [Oscillospiraceae bacterium]
MVDYIEQIRSTLVGLHPTAIYIIAGIIFVFISSVAFLIVLRIRFGAISKDLDANAATGQDGSSFDQMILMNIVTEFSFACTDQPENVNTQAIIEDHFNRELKWTLTAERFVKHSTSMMIVLGLLGTFMGLTISVQSLVLLFRDNDASVILQSVESGLISALVGMSTAFSTSLFGVACSLFVTILNVLFNIENLREKVMVSIEKYLDNSVAKKINRTVAMEYGNLDDILKRTFIEFGEKIAEKFDRSLITLYEDIRGIEEINNNLRNTIALMDVSFTKVAEVLRSPAWNPAGNNRKIDDLADMIADTQKQIEFDSARTLSESAKLAGEVKGAAAAVTELAMRLSKPRPTGHTDGRVPEVQRRSPVNPERGAPPKYHGTGAGQAEVADASQRHRGRGDYPEAGVQPSAPRRMSGHGETDDV